MPKKPASPAAGKMPKKRRTRLALLGEIDRDGTKPIYAWIDQQGMLHFHKSGESFDIEPMSIREIYRRRVGILPLGD